MRASVAPDLMRAPEVVAARGGQLGRPMMLLASTPSTNDEAKHGAKRGARHGATWVAETQTDGRGRQGRSWLATSGESLLFSVLLRDLWEPAHLPRVALVAGLAVRDAVAAAAPAVDCAIKWPNDVLLAGRKVAGVLVEAMTQGARVEGVVVGIGINVFSRSFPDEIAARATSIVLASAEGPPPDRAEILAAVLEGLDRDLHVVSARGLGLLRARLERADALRGRLVRSDGGERGMACGIDDDGRLLVRGDDGAAMAWSAGEVHLV